MDLIFRYGITLRLVEEKDAGFILTLRTDPELSKYISPTSPQIDDQIKWIKEYKLREEAGLEYYFIAQDHIGNRYGTIRLYKFDEDSFEIGSWLFLPNSPMGTAVKTNLIGFELGFDRFGKKYGRLEIRKKNSSVLRYIQEFNPTLTNEDEQSYYFTLTKENFHQRKNKLTLFSREKHSIDLDILIHPSSEVHTSNIGAHTKIWQHCVVLEGAIIGQNCNLNYNVFVENNVIIGDNVTIKSGVQLWDGLKIENNVFIGPNVTFINDRLPRSKNYTNQLVSTIIDEGASIGANSTIMGGIRIGKFAMIGAGSVVTKNIPDLTLWFGNPAVFKANICQCGHKLNNDLVCSNCGIGYKITNGNISEK